MASMLLRSLPRTASAVPRRLIRNISASTSVLQAEPAETSTTQAQAKNAFDYHTVEDLQGMTASQLLAETGSRQEAKMRHFTGESSSSLSVTEQLVNSTCR